MWQILTAIFATLWLATMAASLLLVQRWVKSYEQVSHALTLEREEVNRLRVALIEAAERITRMIRQGFVTLPPDDQFDTYAITPEHEAEIEDARNGRVEPGG